MSVLKKNSKATYETQSPVSDYDRSCPNEPCAGFVWRPNKRPAFVFAPMEPVQIYERQTKRNSFPKRKEKASHNMFIMFFVSLINDHVNYERRHSRIGLEQIVFEWNQHNYIEVKIYIYHIV